MFVLFQVDGNIDFNKAWLHMCIVACLNCHIYFRNFSQSAFFPRTARDDRHLASRHFLLGTGIVIIISITTYYN